MPRLAVILTVFAAALAPLRSADAGTITLRPSVRIDADAPVTLGAIATLDGDDAEALADTPIHTDDAARRDPAGPIEITIDDVRAALEAQRVNWGRLMLRGSICTVSRGPAPAPRTAASQKRQPDRAEPAPVDLAGPPTVRTRLAELLARLYGVTTDNLRVRFDERDTDFLNTPELGRRIEIQPAATPGSSRFAATVWLYSGDTLLDARSLRMDVRLRRPVVLLTRTLDRGDAITPVDVRAETLWVEPIGAAMLASTDAAIGSVARRRLDAGVILRTDVLASPVVVRRGELVTVHCVSGGVVVKAKARAQRDGRIDERITLKMDGSQKTFTARVVAPGRAVVNLDAHAASEEATP